MERIQNLNFGIIKVGWKYVWNWLSQYGVQMYFILKIWCIMIIKCITWQYIK
jgi:hypothetical protein